MQTVAAVNLGAIEKNKGPAAQAGTGFTKLSDQQQTKIGDPSFPNLLAQEQQKESETEILNDLLDVGTKKEEQAEEQAVDGFSISGFIIPLLTPENLQGTVEKAEVPADLIAVDNVSSAELPQGDVPVQQTELKANFINTADVISPEPLKGESGNQAANKADNQAVVESIQAENENSGENLQTSLFMSEPNNAAHSAAPQSETIPVVLSSGNIKETNGQKGSNASQTEQEGQPKLTVNVAKEVIKNLSAMSEENTSGTGSEDSQGARLEENKTENADLHSSGEISTEFIIGSDAAKTSETNEVSRAVEKALNRFVEDLRETKTVGPEIKIVLEPESLGTLTISVSHSESGISAKIRAEDKNVCAMISNELSKLIRSMEAKGITVDHVDVFSGGAEQGFNFSQNNHSGRDGQHLAYKVRAVESTDTSPRSYFSNFWQKITAGEASDGTVEYRV